MGVLHEVDALALQDQIQLAARQRPLTGFALAELRRSKVFIATARLDQDPGNSPRNLAALCHLTYDGDRENWRRSN